MHFLGKGNENELYNVCQNYLNFVKDCILKIFFFTQKKITISAKKRFRECFFLFFLLDMAFSKEVGTVFSPHYRRYDFS